MKKLLALVLLSPLAFAEKSEMIPLNEYLKDQNISHPNVLFYVSARCSAINHKMSYLTQNEKEFSDRSLKAAEFFTQLAAAVRQNISPNITLAENRKKTVETITIISDEYVKVGNDKYAKTGAYFTDWMMDDYELCFETYNLQMQTNN